jgi:hypothetical protein
MDKLEHDMVGQQPQIGDFHQFLPDRHLPDGLRPEYDHEFQVISSLP